MRLWFLLLALIPALSYAETHAPATEKNRPVFSSPKEEILFWQKIRQTKGPAFQYGSKAEADYYREWLKKRKIPHSERRTAEHPFAVAPGIWTSEQFETQILVEQAKLIGNEVSVSMALEALEKEEEDPRRATPSPVAEAAGPKSYREALEAEYPGYYSPSPEIRKDPYQEEWEELESREYRASRLSTESLRRRELHEIASEKETLLRKMEARRKEAVRAREFYNEIRNSK